MRGTVATGLLIAVLAAACGGGGSATPTATSIPAATGTPTATHTSAALQPADSEFPAAGACPEPPAGDVVTWTVNPDTPSPRCSQIRPDQHVRFVNATDESIEIQFAPELLTIAPGGTAEVAAPVGTYLAPGVHVAHTSTYGGESGPEVWVIE